MSKYCRICRNTDCGNHGRDITFHGDGWVCNYIPVPTNADRIRAMDDEELATLLLDGCRGSKCSEQPQNEYGSVDCFSCRLNWLKQPIKEGE